MAVGNHEFDFGLDEAKNTRKFLNSTSQLHTPTPIMLEFSELLIVMKDPKVGGR